MPDWQKRLSEDYLEHYSKVNSVALESEISDRLRGEYDRAYKFHLSSQSETLDVLDLGCGTGTLVSWLSERANVKAVGVDSSTSQISAASKMFPACEFQCTDGREFLENHTQSFDVIICNDVLEHIPTLKDTFDLLEVAKRSLKPGGVFLCRTPNAASLIGVHSLFADLTHYRLFTSQTLVQMLRVAGFENTRVERIEANHLSGRARLYVERVLHLIVFWVCGRTFEKEFTRNVCASGKAPNNSID